jgi:hypothetical protein
MTKRNTTAASAPSGTPRVQVVQKPFMLPKPVPATPKK